MTSITQWMYQTRIHNINYHSLDKSTNFIQIDTSFTRMHTTLSVTYFVCQEIWAKSL